MLDLRRIEENPEELRATLKKRRQDDSFVDQLVEIFKASKSLQTKIEEMRSRRNKESKEIGRILKTDPTTAELKKEEIRKLGDQIQELEKKHEELRLQIEDIVLQLPNWLDPEVPDGDDSRQNVIIKQVGEIPKYDFEVKPHYEIGERLGILDFERGVKLAGSRFYTYRGLGAKLERALMNFMLDLHTKKNGYEEVWVPVLIKDQGMVTTGQYPKFKGEYYQLERDGLSLIPTAEVPLVNLYYDEIIPENQLPIKITAASSCFRREAGAAGKDTRGLIRVHQFQKVELVQITHPNTSKQAHLEMLQHAEMVLQELGLTYRVVLLCSGDMGATAVKTYDLEVWIPGLQRWLEISSVSNCWDYQARRGRIRIRTEKGNIYAHTLNGSGLAIGRTLVAILENYQTSNGEILIPKVLEPYL
ncbi:MAG: serine--tRNA ligase [Leptospiraceae bacterium]|nr:serine--tRNA ligase [Leptospiraceae bacterium]MDW7976960.1 serine--tRNA ligase [Leptospiraceae bacterium]